MTKRKYFIEKTAGLFIIDKITKKVLIIQSIGGNYGFPKGHREKSDKSILDTAIRETKEEVGIKVKKSEILKNIQVTSDFYFFRKKTKNPKERPVGWIKKNLIMYIAIIDSKKHNIKIQKEELKSAKFIKFDKVKSLIEKKEIQKYGKIGSIAKKIIKMSNQVKKIIN
jgi:ADP-ribose pyrophosphatase YjhB (NUDIX family)